MEEYQRTLLAAQGYCELQMFDDALAELDSLPEEGREQPAALELRLVVFMQAKRWKKALEIAKHLCALRPESSAGFIHTAFCLHELGKTQEARDMLLSGPEAMRQDGTFHYNLACYECRLGNLELARMHLEKSVEIDKKFRDYAKTDPDLEPLRSRH